MWPNDADGNAIRGALGPLLEEGRLHDRRPGRLPGRDERLHGADHEVQVSEDCQIFNTFPIPPDFATFWRQAAQQGYTKHDEDRADRQDRPVRLAGRRPSARSATTSRAACTGAPTWPYNSSLTGITNKQLGDGYEADGQAVEPAARGRASRCSTSRAAALKASGNPKDKRPVANAMKTLDGRRRRSATCDWGKNRTRCRHRRVRIVARRSSAASGVKNGSQVADRLRDLRALRRPATSRRRRSCSRTS